MSQRRSPLPRRLAIVFVATLIAWWGAREHSPPGTAPSRVESSAAWHASDDPLLTAYLNRKSDVQIESEGVVKRVLPDDRNGSRHQRFILEGPSGRTVLVAHNIDLAPRVPDLAPGARIAFHGEYEWNERGGVIHWTHHDPRGEHPGGWIEFRGRRYQ